MTDWQKDLSAVGFEVADLVQRVRTMVLATGALSDRVPEELAPAVAQARFSMDAAVALIEGAADRLLQMDDEEQAAVLVEAGPRFSRPGGTPDPADGWPM